MLHMLFDNPENAHIYFYSLNKDPLCCLNKVDIYNIVGVVICAYIRKLNLRCGPEEARYRQQTIFLITGNKTTKL